MGGWGFTVTGVLSLPICTIITSYQIFDGQIGSITTTSFSGALCKLRVWERGCNDDRSTRIFHGRLQASLFLFHFDRNNTQTAVTNIRYKRILFEIIFYFTFRMLLHTSSEVTVNIKLEFKYSGLLTN